LFFVFLKMGGLRMKKIFLLCAMLLLVSWTISYAVPAAPDVVDIDQPDGTKFKARTHGDEFQNWVEAVDSGHTVVRNKETGHWEYAEKQPDGTLKSSGIKVDPTGQLAPHFIEKGVRPDRDVERENQHKDSLRRVYNKRLAPSYSSSSGGSDGVQTSGPLSAPGDWVPTPVSGSPKVLIVLINFANRTLTTTADNWYHTIFDTTPGVKSVANFYHQNSFGNLTVTPAFTGTTHPGIVAVTIADNHPNCGKSFDKSTEMTILSHALAQATAAVDLSSFDPNTDEAYFVYAGYENSGSPNTPNIWGHAWSGIVTGGSITIDHWALNGELNNASVQHPIGVIAHELGHALCGLPDLYDTYGYNAGLGNFSVMAGGSWGKTPIEESGTTPVALDAWSREYLGWTAPQAPVASGPVTLDVALASANNALKLVNPVLSNSEYWLVENRYPASGSWDEGITGLVGGYSGGLLITHIDNTVGTKGYNDINTHGVGPHQGVVPEQANTVGCNMITTGTCRGSSTTTFYSGNNADFSTATTPNSKYYNASTSNRGINAISARGATMTATVSVTTTPDTVKPVVTAFTIPATSTSLTVPVTTFTATDKVSASTMEVAVAAPYYQITETATAPTSWLGAAPVSYTFSSAGAKKLYAWAKDSAGNVSVSKLASVTIDQTAPVVSAFVVPANYNSLTVPVTTFTATDNVAVAAYQITESSSAPTAEDGNWKSTKPTSYLFGSIGAKTLYAWAKDTAGNVSLSKSAPVLLETTAPTVNTFTLNASLVAGLTIPITVFDATDNAGGSDIGGYKITETATVPLATAAGWSLTKPVSYTTTASGAKTLYAWARDKAGNVSQPKTASVTADAVKPVVTAFTIPPAANTLTIPVNSFTATDKISTSTLEVAVPTASYLITETATVPLSSNPGWSASAPGSYTFTSVGAKKLYAWAQDTAGNISLSKMAPVVIDQAAPVVSVFVVPAAANTLTVPVTLTATDNVAVAAYQITESATAPTALDGNWKSTKPTSYTFASLGSKTLYAWAKDTAGNVSLSKSAPVLLETTAPTVNTFTLNAPLVAGLTIPITVFDASDNAGGSDIGGYKITETATAPLATAAGWSLTKPVSYTTTASGAKTLYAWARDKAGNVSTAKTASVTADAVKPLVTAFTIPLAANTLTIPVNSFTATDKISASTLEVAVAAAAYLITETATAPLASNPSWSSSAPVSYTFTSTGAKSLYAWAQDTAGNISLSRKALVTIDQTLPVVSVFVVPASYNSLTVPVTTFTATDNVAVAAYQITESSTAPAASDGNWKTIKPTSYLFSSTGAKTLYAWAKDKAGNVSLSKSAPVTLN
jgi:M6 family metalloprotease-like protein